MAFFIDKNGVKQDVEVSASLYKQALDENKTVAHLINTQYPDADPTVGPAFNQICASTGLSLVGKNPFGLRAATIDRP